MEELEFETMDGMIAFNGELLLTWDGNPEIDKKISRWFRLCFYQTKKNFVAVLHYTTNKKFEESSTKIFARAEPEDVVDAILAWDYQRLVSYWPETKDEKPREDMQLRNKIIKEALRKQIEDLCNAIEKEMGIAQVIE